MAQPQRGGLDRKTGERKSQYMVLRDFKGINTQSDIRSVPNDEFPWLENAMPIGSGNIQIVMAAAAALAGTIGSGTVNYMVDGNVGSTDFLYCFTTTGAFYSVNLGTGAVTQLAAAGSFSNSGVAACQWSNLGLLIVDPAKGYFDWNVTAGSTLTTIDASKTGIAISVFSGRVWIALQASRTIVFTGTNGYNDFNPANASGSFVITDYTLHNVITGLFTANNFLYIFGEDSVDVLGDVRVASGITLFTRTNLTFSIGTLYGTAITAYYRSVIFMNTYGVYVMNGATPQKISDALDGIFSSIDFTKPITCGVVMLENILCAAFNFTYIDPVSGSRPLMAIFFNNKWFVASQNQQFTHLIARGNVVGGIPSLYATDGTHIFQCFASSSININSKITAKEYDFGSFPFWHSAIGMGIGINFPVAPASITVNITSAEAASQTLTQTASNVGNWVNNAGQVGLWFNNGAVTGSWLGSGYQLLNFGIQQYGRNIGFSITSSTPGLNYDVFVMEHQEYLEGGNAWRGP